ncbi:MAG: zf-HC2 domain-containing protein [Planctomycetota bacterium]
MTSDEEKLADWTSCPDGTLAGFSKQHRTVALRVHALKLAGVGLAVLLCLGAYTFLPSSQPENSFGFTCTEVKENMDGYLQGTLVAMDEQKIKEHLQYCPSCKAKYQAEADRRGVEFIVQRNDPNYSARLFLASLALESISVEDR